MRRSIWSRLFNVILGFMFLSFAILAGTMSVPTAVADNKPVQTFKFEPINQFKAVIDLNTGKMVQLESNLPIQHLDVAVTNPLPTESDNVVKEPQVINNYYWKEKLVPVPKLVDRYPVLPLRKMKTPPISPTMNPPKVECMGVIISRNLDRL